MVNVCIWFNLWKTNTKNNIIKRQQNYDDWCEIHNEMLNEQQYAKEYSMPSIYWCWNCQYNECNVHIN